MAERERAEHMQQVQARGAELEELKRMRVEAKLAANATKAENKQTLLRMQRERLKQQDAERQSRTEQAMKVGRVPGRGGGLGRMMVRARGRLGARSIYSWCEKRCGVERSTRST